jgi:hypothetical protein
MPYVWVPELADPHECVCGGKKGKDERICQACHKAIRDEMKRRGVVADYDEHTGLYLLKPPDA